MAADNQSWWRRLLGRLERATDDHLPMSPEEREERDFGDLDPAELAERRQLRLKMRMLEKEGKGGPR